MNGRVYNPTLARFVSADPLISNPDDTQNYNRYSYVHNRPMFYTDPSGFESANDNEEKYCNCDVVEGGFAAEKTADINTAGNRVRAIMAKQGAAGTPAAPINSLDAGSGGAKGISSEGKGVGAVAENEGLDDVTQPKLSQKEINKRLSLLDEKIEINATLLNPRIQKDEKLRAKASLNSYVKTDEGYNQLSKYKGSGILIMLKATGRSSVPPRTRKEELRNAKDRIDININGNGYAQVSGYNTFAELNGVRMYAHELHHAINPVYQGDRAEVTAMESANRAMRQYGGSMDATYDVGVRENYYLTTTKLPIGARIKETFSPL